MFECMRCIYTDSPCLPSDYGKDYYNHCNHFKNVFEENVRLKEQNSKAKEIIKQFLNDYPVITKELLDKLEQFVKECENE